MLQHYGPQLVNLLASVMLLLAFAMLSQRRIISLINLFAAQGFTLFLSTALVAWMTGQTHCTPRRCSRWRSKSSRCPGSCTG